MSGPPPGYNPGESMFQGGSTAAIHAVQGGGGALPAGFEQQSLLHGGEGAAIHPVQGGGAGVTSPLVVIKDLSALTIPAKREDGTSDLPATFDDMLTASKGQFVELAKGYILKQRDGLWRRSNPTEVNAVERPRMLTTENCATPTSGRLDDEKGVAGFDRLAVILPSYTEEILVFPPVRSSRRAFYACLDYLKGLGLMDDKGDMKGPVAKQAEVGVSTKVVVFAPPFLMLDAKNVPGYLESNRKLLAHFLKLKAQYPNMYILTQSTAMNKMIGNCIAAEASSMPLLNMLEPTYVIYPFLRVEEVADPNDLLDISGNQKVVRGGILFSAAAANEALLPASNLPSRIASPSIYVQKKGKTSIAYLPNPRVEDAKLNKMYDSLKLRFYGEGAEIMAPTEIRRFIVQQSPAETVATERGENTDIFQSADDHSLALDDVVYTRVPLDGRIYAFRAPGSPGVMNDWKGGRFTRDEADFLNQLQLRPKLLPEIFKDDNDIPERLAGFLQNMAIGRCFTDERMLTASECQDSRDFVNRVYNYYLMHDERLEELRGAEEAAQKRMARLRIETAEGRMQAAQGAMREKQQEDMKGLNQIKASAAYLGVDLGRPVEEYEKNPMDPKTGGPVEVIRKVDTIMQPSQDTENPIKHTMQVIVFKRKPSNDETTGHTYIDYWTGTVKFDVNEGEEKVKKMQQTLENMNKEYPGYYIVQDFSD